MDTTKGVFISRIFQLKFHGPLSLGWQVTGLSLNQDFSQENNKMLSFELEFLGNGERVRPIQTNGRREKR